MQVFYKFAKAVWFDQLHWQTWNFWCTTVDTISVESLHFSNTSGCKAHCRCRGGIVWTWDPVLAILRCEILSNICHRKWYEIRTVHVSGLSTLKDDGKNHGRTKFLSANLGVQNVAHRRLMIAWYGDGDVVTCTDQKYISRTGLIGIMRVCRPDETELVRCTGFAVCCFLLCRRSISLSCRVSPSVRKPGATCGNKREKFLVSFAWCLWPKQF